MVQEGSQLASRRQIVSYFDHEFIKPSARKLERDVCEMTDAGFTNVVLAVTESDVRSRHRQAYLADAVGYMQAEGLEVWADPWAVGGVFGGEGVSHFKASGEISCYHNSKLEYLLDQWLDTTAHLGVETVFWDEPEMHCEPHRSDELRFLEKYTRKAGALALDSVVCLCANRKKKHQLQQVVALPDVVEIATDPYYPNAFERITEDRRLQYIADWAQYTKETAEAYGKRSHVWLQDFEVLEGREQMIDEHVAIAAALGIDMAIWGFRGCESVPNFVKPGCASPSVLWNRMVGALALQRVA